jgi:hypothetical protein
MKNTFVIICNILLGSLALLLISTSVFAAPVIRKASGANTSDLALTMAFFRQDLGGTINPAGNSYTSGRREIDWEDYQPVLSYGDGPAQFPYEYYNKIKPLGVVFNTAYDASNSITTMNVSSPSQNNPGYVQFKRTDLTYAPLFKPFSGTKMFASLINTRFEATFCIPGTNIPATVKGFGAVLADIEDYAYMTFYDEAGKIIHGEGISGTTVNDSYTFVGVSFPDGTRIARVDIQLGTTPIYESADGTKPECSTPTCSTDYVAMDNVIFGEPRAMRHHSSDFDGDGTTDYAVFRPSNGAWYLMNSGTNTFQGVQFGANGDIPADGDFDGDSRSDYAVFRPSNGTWYILRSRDNQFQAVQFGASGDKSVAGDYDKDGITDIAVWRGGNYYILQSSDNQFKAAQFGQAGDVPIGAAVQ